MDILITGSKGQLGKELQKHLYNHTLILTEIESLNICSIDQTLELVKSIKPKVIINCAGFTSVEQCETNPEIAYLSNAIGPRNLAIAANEINCEMIHISTDYVFDGKGIKDKEGIIRPYNEFDRTNPLSIYGQSKLAGENFVKELTNKYYIIRTAWLYGDGNNFVNTIIRLSNRLDIVKVVNDQFGSPTSTKELANMIEKLIDSYEYGLYHGSCEGQCSWYDFAKEIFKSKSIRKELIPVSSEEFTNLVKRPHYSVLENKMLKLSGLYQFSNWKDAFRDYILKK